MSTQNQSKIRYLTQVESQKIDQRLMSDEFGFSLDQLMELAGLSCAESIYHFYKPNYYQYRNVVILCGPGNNGGDGLVCARHLTHFGYSVTVVYPKLDSPKHEIYKRLLIQLRTLNVKLMDSLPSNQFSHYDIIVDGMFGFSFRCTSLDDIRSPYKETINLIVKEVLNNSNVRLVSIDIPSGWDVERGDIHSTGLNPHLLISLTAPKLCSKNFNQNHVVGGRFVPHSMAKEFTIDQINYEGSQQFAIVTTGKSKSTGEL